MDAFSLTDWASTFVSRYGKERIVISRFRDDAMGRWERDKPFRGAFAKLRATQSKYCVKDACSERYRKAIVGLAWLLGNSPSQPPGAVTSTTLGPAWPTIFSGPGERAVSSSTHLILTFPTSSTTIVFITTHVPNFSRFPFPKMLDSYSRLKSE